jgi:group I intron endonuclease
LYYTIYKTTNKINNKIYIGKHETDNPNDDYIGSGKHLKRAINKYGIENFTKEILFIFETEDDMNAKERELVTEEFCSRADTYNLCPGGKGGFGYLNSYGLNNSNKDMSIIGVKISKSLTGKLRPDVSVLLRKRHAKGLVKYDTFTGKSHSEETKRKISEHNKSLVGDKNSQFGTVWITNGFNNKKIKSVDEIPNGWYRGRKL